MSEPRRWWVNIQDQDGRSVKRDADRLCLAGPEPEPEGHEVFIEVIEAEPVLARIKELESQLKEANEALSWYADEKNWRTPAMSTNCATDMQFMQFDDIEKVEIKNKGHWRRVAGQRARAYLKKWEGK